MSAVVATQPRGSRAGGDAQKALSLDALTSTPQVRLLRRPQRGGLALVYAPPSPSHTFAGIRELSHQRPFSVRHYCCSRSFVSCCSWGLGPLCACAQPVGCPRLPGFFTGGLSRSWLWTRRQRQALAQGPPRGPLPGCLRDAWSPPLTRLAFLFPPGGVCSPLCVCCLCPT